MYLAYVSRRFGMMLLVILLAVTINFVIPRLMPGDPIEQQLSQMVSSGGGQVGEAHLVAGEPATLVGEVVHVGEMMADVRADRPQRAGIRGAGDVRHQMPIDTLDQKLARHLAVELAVEPIDEAALLGSLGRAAVEERRAPPVLLAIGEDLGEVLGDRIGAAEERSAIEGEDGELARRIEGQELGAPFPRTLVRQRHLCADLGQRKPDRARFGAKPELR